MVEQRGGAERCGCVEAATPPPLSCRSNPVPPPGSSPPHPGRTRCEGGDATEVGGGGGGG